MTMEKILNQILTKVEGLEEGLTGLKEGQTKIEKDVAGLKEGQAKIEKDVAGLKEGQAKLEAGQDKLVERFDRLENKVDIIYRQTGELTEFKTETVIKLDKLLEGQEKISRDVLFLAGELGIHKLELDRLKRQSV